MSVDEERGAKLSVPDGCAVGEHEGVVLDQPYVDYARYQVIPHQVLVCRKCGKVLQG